MIFRKKQKRDRQCPGLQETDGQNLQSDLPRRVYLPPKRRRVQEMPKSGLLANVEWEDQPCHPKDGREGSNFCQPN